MSKGDVSDSTKTTSQTVRAFARFAKSHPNSFAFDMSFYKYALDRSGKHNAGQQPTNGFLGLKLALALCKDVKVYGFVRNWKGWFEYHYFNDERPNSGQMKRDTDGELPLIKRLLRKNPHIRWAHPCVMDQTCQGCAGGSHCVQHVPFAVAQPGHCHVKGTKCFPKCSPGQTCPGVETSEDAKARRWCKGPWKCSQDCDCKLSRP